MNTRNKFYSGVLAASVVIVSMLMTSCVDDDFRKSILFSDEHITFHASVSDVWRPENGTRGANSYIASKVHNEEVKKGYKLTGHTPGHPLYIFESVSDYFEYGQDAVSKPDTRGAVVNNSSFTGLKMGVYSYFTGHPEEPLYMRNVPYAFHGSYWSSQGENYLWPIANNDDNQLGFFAYAPYNSDNTGKSGNPLLKIDKIEGNIKLHYTVADSLIDQPDLIVSELTKINNIESIPSEGATLNMHHALTSVRFVCKKNGIYPGVITNVTICNIAGSGEYDVTTAKWEADPTLRNFSFKCATPIVIDDYGHVNDYTTKQSDVIGSSGVTLMMIPQNSKQREGPKPKIRITYKDDATRTQRVFETELDIDWQQGKSVCYYISTTNLETVYTFDVKVKGGAYIEHGFPGEVIEGVGREIYACGNEGVDLNRQPEITVESYYTVYQYDENTKEVISKGKCPAPWGSKVEVSVNDGKYADVGDDPKWFKTHSLLKGEGKLGKDQLVTSVPIELSAVSTFTIDKEEAQLIKNHTKTYVDYDLSRENGTGKRNTANCYIVGAPGSYKIPLVYGNAISDDETYSQAYTCNLSGNNILRKFVKHDNLPITDPWIYKNKDVSGNYLKPKSAEIIRFESINENPGDPIHSGEKEIDITHLDDEYLYFNITPVTEGANEYIYPANAVIAVKDDSGKILWHWHLWITAYFHNQDASHTTQVGNYEMMNYALGQLFPTCKTYDSRKLIIKISQTRNTGGVVSKGLQFEQKGFDAIGYEQTLYYQFGRMDPVYAYFFQRYINKSGNPEIEGYHRIFISSNKYNSTSNRHDIDIKVVSSNKIGYVIQNPLNIYNSSSHHVYKDEYGNDVDYTNLWNNGTIYAPIKTVYDPCPPGYMVPPTEDIWTDVITAYPPFNFDIIHRPNDYHFMYGTMKFPRGITGLFNNGISQNFRYTSYWTSHYDAVPHAVSFSFSAQSITPQLNEPDYTGPQKNDKFKSAYLSAIRPVKEPTPRIRSLHQ